jgi:hypothetical protein
MRDFVPVRKLGSSHLVCLLWRALHNLVEAAGILGRYRGAGCLCLSERSEESRIFLEANYRTLNHGSNVNARLRRIRSSSAPRALSEVEVFCAEKDPGFFAALRMTTRESAPAHSAVLPLPSCAQLFLQGEETESYRIAGNHPVADPPEPGSRLCVKRGGRSCRPLEYGSLKLHMAGLVSKALESCTPRTAPPGGMRPGRFLQL